MTINRQPPLLLPMMDLWKWIPVMWHAPAPVAAIQFCGSGRRLKATTGA